MKKLKIVKKTDFKGKNLIIFEINCKNSGLEVKS